MLLWLFCILTVASAALLVITRSILYGAYSLVICLLSLAALYVLLQAEFVGITQLMIYVGGIIILLLFAIMLTNKLKGETLITSHYNRIFAILLFGSAFLCTGWMAVNWHGGSFPDRAIPELMHATGVYLMSVYLFPMEVIAVLLLIVLIGALTIAGEKTGKEGRR